MTDEHICRAEATQKGELVMDVWNTEFRTESQSTGTLQCTCGKTFEDRKKARKHIVEANNNK